MARAVGVHLILGVRRLVIREEWRLMCSLRERTVQSAGLHEAQTAKVHLASWQATN